MKLQRLPQPLLRFARITGTNQQIERGTMPFQKIGSHMRTDIARGTGQEYRHVAPFAPVFTVSPLPASAARSKLRDALLTGARIYTALMVDSLLLK